MKHILSFLFIPFLVFTTKSYSQCEFEISDTSLQNVTSFLLFTHPTFVDIDNDGDMDVFIGDDNGVINYYKNTGSSTSPVFSRQIGSGNPFDGVDVGDISAPTFVDIDNDGDMDAFIGEYDGGIYYYKNTGSYTSPVFSLQNSSGNPFDGVDVGYASAPIFVDIDNDGDMDAFIGENYGGIFYYKNTGSFVSPVFSQQNGSNNSFNGVDVGQYSAPTFVDIDNDGDMDAFIGENDGVINYYKNTGISTSPVYSLQAGSSNPFDGVDVSQYSAPTFVDIDNDGDMDAFIGEGEFEGIINYYKNTGSYTSPVFSSQSPSNNPFDGVDVGDDSAPTFVDIDNDGDLDVFIGESLGVINYYKNMGSSTSPVYSPQAGSSNPFNGIDVGTESAPTFVDIDNDGDIDAFIGKSDGNINYYKNTGNSSSPVFSLQSGSNNPFDGFDVGDDIAPTFVDIDNDGDIDAFIGKTDGNINYYKNTGNSSSPVFSLQSGSLNPFNGIDVGTESAPTFVDIDNDGDIDAFIGENDGGIFYYKNTGNSSSPVFSLQSGSLNLLDGVDVGHFSAPTFVDIDNDGDIDAFIGDYDGEIFFIKNACINGSSAIYSEQLKETNSLVVYPNPSNGIVNIEFQSSQNNSSTITLFDVVGKMVYQNAIIGNTTQLSVAKLPNGIYLLVVKTEVEILTKRIAVVH